MKPEEKILRILKDAKWGLTVSEIAEKAKMSRLTATKYLETLKAKGLIIEKKVGAYRLWFRKDYVKDKSLFSKRLACALAKAFILVFDEKAEEVARKIGIALVDILEDDEFVLGEKGIETLSSNPYELIASILENISEGIKADGIELSDGRGVLRITGDLCEDEGVVKVLGILLLGAVEGILKNIIGLEKPRIKIQVNKRIGGYEIILEVY